MFLGRLQGNPHLDGVGTVVVDEFHERSLDADLSLALVKRLRQRQADLRLASLKSGNCPVFNCHGRTFPIEMRYLE